MSVVGVVLFFPHYILMFFFGPEYPIHDNGVVDYGEVLGKLAVVFPASLAYGIVIVAGLALIKKIVRRPKHEA